MLAYALMIGVVSILAIGTVLQVLFDLPFAAVLVGGGVVVIYSAIGGMWSLTLTDIVQFVIKTVGRCSSCCSACSLDAAGGLDGIRSRVMPASQLDGSADTIITYFMIYFFGILIGQDIWQRVFTVKTPKWLAGRRYAGFYCILYGWPVP